MINEQSFDEWWEEIGRSFDPDTDDVSWYDKRRGLAEEAFRAGVARAMNYTADSAESPKQITLGGGRVITARARNGRPYLTVTPR